MKALVFDTETTGLPFHPDAPMEKQPRVIEFGGILVDTDTGAEIDEFDTLINPGVKLDPKITKITGLTDEDLKDAPTFAAMEEQIRRLFAKADVLIAHNLPFDTRLIELELERLGIEDWPWPPIKICTVQESFDGWGRRARMKELYARLAGTKLEQTHRALDDVRALVLICRELEVFNELSAIAREN